MGTTSAPLEPNTLATCTLSSLGERKSVTDHSVRRWTSSHPMQDHSRSHREHLPVAVPAAMNRIDPSWRSLLLYGGSRGQSRHSEPDFLGRLLRPRERGLNRPPFLTGRSLPAAIASYGQTTTTNAQDQQPHCRHLIWLG